MARVTVEDCLNFVENRYELVHLCVKRTRQLFRGADRLVVCKNNEVVTALREIASGKVRFHIQHAPVVDDGETTPSATLTQ
ncbi:MAG: DNA-directed RNA polymerase subunit omega [Bdellovibrionota bacterium]